MNSIIPPFLRPGDTIGITASARWITPEQLQPAVDIIRQWGFKCLLSPLLFERHDQLAGNDAQRTNALQHMMDDPAVSAILFARGGYGTVRILDQLDFSAFRKKPKWMCGYSDITALHNRLYHYGIASVHSTMPVSFPDATAAALESLRQALTGELHEVKWNLGSDARLKSNYPIQGMVSGGNLSIIYSVLGSPDQVNGKGSILFIEDVDEMLYHVDRMMMNLKRANVLAGVKAIVLGGMTQMKDNTKAFGFPDDNPFGSSAVQIVCRIAEELELPVFTGFPAGHQSNNCAFYLGREAELSISGQEALLQYIP